jgi:NitT/TauT family transport system substrate-binding protein
LNNKLRKQQDDQEGDVRGNLTIAAMALMAGVSALVIALADARAETNQVRIASTYGLAQLPGRLAFEQGFIEKHAKRLGLTDLKVTFQPVSSGIVVSDLLLSRNADVGVGGNVPLFSLWDKTNGAQKVRGIMSFSRANMFLLTVDPRIKTMRDFTDTDRIAMTDVRSTTYSMVIQMAAAKEYGWDQRTRYDQLTVAMGNNEALAAMLSGRMEVKSHMTILPHSTMELKSGKVRILLNSKELLGDPYTTVVSFATTRFKQDNPTAYTAVVAGLQEAIDFITNKPREAAEIFVKKEPFTGTLDELVEMIQGKTADELSFNSTPNTTELFTDFMVKSGTLRNKPASWKDIWFENTWDKAGS